MVGRQQRLAVTAEIAAAGRTIQHVRTHHFNRFLDGAGQGTGVTSAQLHIQIVFQRFLRNGELHANGDMIVTSGPALAGLVFGKSFALTLNRGGTETGHQHIFFKRLVRGIGIENSGIFIGVLPIFHTEMRVKTLFKVFRKTGAIHSHDLLLLFVITTIN